MLHLAVDSAGLILDIIGVGLVFCFGLPAERSRAHRELPFPREPADLARKTLCVLGYSGLALLMVGFLLQLLANAIGADLTVVPP